MVGKLPRLYLPATLAKAVSVAQVAQTIWDARRKDFWNHPERWDGIDPHRDMIWTKRHPDKIDVRKKGAVNNQ